MVTTSSLFNDIFIIFLLFSSLSPHRYLGCDSEVTGDFTNFNSVANAVFTKFTITMINTELVYLKGCNSL